MKKYITLFLIFLSVLILPKDAKAYTVYNLNRTECSNFELVTISSEQINHIECYDTFQDAKNEMEKLELETGIPSIVKNNKIIDSRYALVNLRTKPSSNYNTYMYSTETSTSASSYINGYYAADGALINVYYTGNTETTRAKVALSGLKEYVRNTEDNLLAYEIVPLTQVKSPNKYMVVNGSLVHYIAREIGNNNSYSSSYSLGPSPEYLKEDTAYYSYDGNYFYTDLYKLIDDYKAGSYTNAVNAEKPYYNYYQYLPQRSKTNMTSAELDTYLRGEGKTISNSKLYGQAHYFITAQNTYGINALISYGISLNESAKGSSNIAFNKNNVFGHAAYDYDPSGSSTQYSSVMYSVYYHADVYMSQGYAYTGDWRYFGSHLGNKLSGVNVKYASDPYWGEKATAYYYTIDRKNSLKDYDYYTIGIKKVTSAVNVRSEATTSSKVVYTIPANKYPTFVIVDEVVGDEYDGSNIWYKVLFDSALSNLSPNKTAKYSFQNYVYIHSKTLEKINNPESYKNPNDIVTKDTGISYEKATTEQYYEISKDTNMYYDSTLTVNTYYTLKKGSKVLLVEKAIDKNGDKSYLVTYGDRTEWIDAKNTTYNDEYNKLISSIKYKTLEQPLLLKVTADQTLYSDSVLLNSISLTQKKDTHVIATKLAYTDEKNYSYEIIYDIQSGATAYIDAKQVATSTTYSIGSNQNNNLLNIRKEANTTSSRVGTISIEYSKFIILDKVTGQEINGNNSWYKIIYNSPNNSVGYISSAYVTVLVESSKQDNTTTVTPKPEESKPEEPKEEEPPKEEKPTEPEVEKEEIKYTTKDGLFDLTKLSYDSKTKKFNIIGTLKVNGVELSESYNVEYSLILKDVNGKQQDKIIKLNEHAYSNININANIDLTNIEQGDYFIYVRARVKTYEAVVLLNNVFGRTIPRKTTIDNRGYLFRVNYYSNYVPIELSIRNEGNITTKNNPTNDNMFNDYVNIDLKDNKLLIKGTSYNVGGSYSTSNDVKRQIILENISTFKRTTYDVGYSDNGDYEVTLRVPDNKSKKRAWFDASLDLSKLEKGTYVIYIKTTTTEVDDYGELTDIFQRDLSSKTMTLSNGNKVKLKLNKNVRMRIELVIE